jgi:hypothetical protein
MEALDYSYPAQSVKLQCVKPQSLPVRLTGLDPEVAYVGGEVLDGPDTCSGKCFFDEPFCQRAEVAPAKLQKGGRRLLIA